MAVEIERKYLVNADQWNVVDKGDRHFFRQGYMLVDAEKTIRVRLADEEGFITVKGKSIGASRLEYEYTIPKHDAIELLDRFCASEISKYRYYIAHGGRVWEVDEFLGANEGLVVAEIELSSEDEIFETPPWIDQEVTGDEKYYNSSLSKHPFSR